MKHTPQRLAALHDGMLKMEPVIAFRLSSIFPGAPNSLRKYYDIVHDGKEYILQWSALLPNDIVDILTHRFADLAECSPKNGSCSG
jgi:hypothetical protein